jgi:hypothetical protein
MLQECRVPTSAPAHGSALQWGRYFMHCLSGMDSLHADRENESGA